MNGRTCHCWTCPTLGPAPYLQVHYGGEDAHFFSDVGGGALGVADGVGGWQESGVNPAGENPYWQFCLHGTLRDDAFAFIYFAEYSRTFMRMACAYLEGKDIFETDALDRGSIPFIDPRVRRENGSWASCPRFPLETFHMGPMHAHGSQPGTTCTCRTQGALHAAHQSTKVPGSATACVMQLDQERHMLEAANLVRDRSTGFVTCLDTCDIPGTQSGLLGLMHAPCALPTLYQHDARCIFTVSCSCQLQVHNASGRSPPCCMACISSVAACNAT